MSMPLYTHELLITEAEGVMLKATLTSLLPVLPKQELFMENILLELRQKVNMFTKYGEAQTRIILHIFDRDLELLAKILAYGQDRGHVDLRLQESYAKFQRRLRAPVHTYPVLGAWYEGIPEVQYDSEEEYLEWLRSVAHIKLVKGDGELEHFYFWEWKQAKETRELMMGDDERWILKRREDLPS